MFVEKSEYRIGLISDYLENKDIQMCSALALLKLTSAQSTPNLSFLSIS